MYYLDGSKRSPSDALGHWIDQETPNGIQHLRMMSGYFGLSGLGAFQDIISELNKSGQPITTVLGANNKETVKVDLDDYLDLVLAPRSGVKTAIVSYANGLFHPKVYHLSRTDGSALAYLGSANLTDFGINSGNIEAGILLDTRGSDDPGILAQIAASIDCWFGTSNQAVNEINTHSDVNALAKKGIIGIAARPPQLNGGKSAGKTKKPSLRPVVNLGNKLRKKRKGASQPINPIPPQPPGTPGTGVAPANTV